MFKRLIAGILLLGLVTISLHTPAMSQDRPEWFLIDTNKTGTQIFARTIDLQAGRPESRAAKLWVKIDASRDRTVSWREIKTLYAVDCIAETYRVITTHVAYSTKQSETIPGDMKLQFVVPGSVMAGATEILCSSPEEQTSSADVGYTA